MKLNQAGRDLIARNPVPTVDIDEAEETLRDCVRVPLNENQYNALLSLVCSMNGNNFRTSDLLAYLNSGDIESFRIVYSKYGRYQSMFLRDEELELWDKPDLRVVGGTDVKNIA